MVDTNLNRAVEILKENKSHLLNHNELLSENIEECHKRADGYAEKMNENIKKVDEIDQAIIKLQSK